MYRELVRKYAKNLSPEATLAQMYLESGYRPGQPLSWLASPPNHNLFGIKYKGTGTWDWFDTWEWVDGKKVKVKDKFQTYPSYEESIKHHDEFFVSTPERVKRYAKVVAAQTPEEEFIELGKSGYATDPDYAKKLLDIYNEYIKEESDMTILLIAGHGTNPNNGYFDPGAGGFIPMGEHKYMRDKLFPAMKKYSGDKIKYFSQYNVYSVGNLVSLANSYGKDTVVVEMHFDATGNNTASGGHVIIYGDFAPDKIDLALRDAIAKNVGLAYPVHKGEKGISGRKDLANPNRAANGGVNYRLLELGFGTNKKDADYMLNNVDQYAKDLVTALTGGTVNVDDSKPATDPRVVSLPDYREPVKTFAPLAKGAKDQIRDEVFNFWYRPQTKDGYKPSVDVRGKQVTIVDVMDVSVSYSKRAYLVKEYNSWVLEQDLMGPRAKWTVEQDDVQNTGQNYLFWDGYRYEIGSKVED